MFLNKISTIPESSVVSIDIIDLGILATFYGTGTTVAASSVPEPGSITLLLCGLTSLIYWKRRK
ncbi:MAG: PEP-CTERM sorting domain-containing protein [Pirellulales bacterium]|nr:PEP-CTERM sorting domain-containing protein [Pirellulales bacterium]